MGSIRDSIEAACHGNGIMRAIAKSIGRSLDYVADIADEDDGPARIERAHRVLNDERDASERIPCAALVQKLEGILGGDEFSDGDELEGDDAGENPLHGDAYRLASGRKRRKGPGLPKRVVRP